MRGHELYATAELGSLVLHGEDLAVLVAEEGVGAVDAHASCDERQRTVGREALHAGVDRDIIERSNAHDRRLQEQRRLERVGIDAIGEDRPILRIAEDVGSRLQFGEGRGVEIVCAGSSAGDNCEVKTALSRAIDNTGRPPRADWQPDCFARRDR